MFHIAQANAQDCAASKVCLHLVNNKPLGQPFSALHLPSDLQASKIVQEGDLEIICINLKAKPLK